MAATQTVAQLPLLRKSAQDSSKLVPRHGVITLYGYGIVVRVDRGHLVLEDGIGTDRFCCRLPRVDHELKRLIVIGSDGVVSLSALRWLADQDASFVMLDRDGSVLTTTGPVRSSDVRLRRAQALALQNGVALRISRELVDRKLAGQERVAMHDLANEAVAHSIRQCRTDLAEAFSISDVRLVESQAAKAYWSAWRDVPILFPRKDLPRVPRHWLVFGHRISVLTGSPRLATNPVNAMLNYLYALLEAETRLAAATLGLDPGIGVLHVDVPYRDSLALDLMEVVRPDVDAFVLDWIKLGPLPRSHFFEQRDGNCRLMAGFASTLSQTASKWAQLIAPVAEWFAREINLLKRERRYDVLPARLTQSNKRIAKGSRPLPTAKASVKPERICHDCGKQIIGDSIRCKACSTEIMTEQRDAAGRIARTVALSPEAQQKRAATQQINALARHAWKPSDQPSWLTANFYSEKIQPALLGVRGSSIARTLNVSNSYARDIRKGLVVPHPRHWISLANLVSSIEAMNQPETGQRNQPGKRKFSKVPGGRSSSPRYSVGGTQLSCSTVP
jgi:CRISPR-associated endonuclease Cas1